MDELTFAPLADHPAFVDVIASWLEAEWPDDFASHDARAHLNEMNRDRMPIAIVAVARGTPVGAVALRPTSTMARSELTPWLSWLYVHPEIRGHGIGAALLRAAVSIAWSHGFDAVYADATRPQFFERFGFEHDDEVLKLEKPPTLYRQLGGEQAIHDLVERFYDVMDELAEASTVRGLHAASLKVSRDKLFKFLSGWTGGPSLYVEQYGHPRLRGRHLPFAIGTAARDEWMLCMNLALEDTVAEPGVRRELSNAFARMADHMINREGP